MACGLKVYVSEKYELHVLNIQKRRTCSSKNGTRVFISIRGLAGWFSVFQLKECLREQRAEIAEHKAY